MRHRRTSPRTRPSGDDGSLTDRVFNDLKARILCLELKPGERLIESRIASEWGISRTPVREVYQRLTQAGLVRSVPGRGYYVRELNLRQIEELYEVRLALETFAVTRAADGMPAAELERLLALWPEEAASLPNPQTMLSMDEEFHLSIARATGNTTLSATLGSINEAIRAVRAKDFLVPARITASFRQHHRILRLIQAGSPEAAGAAMREHILESKANVFGALKELLAAVYLEQPPRRHEDQAPGPGSVAG